jgi:hypothetical protein
MARPVSADVEMLRWETPRRSAAQEKQSSAKSVPDKQPRRISNSFVNELMHFRHVLLPGSISA